MTSTTPGRTGLVSLNVVLVDGNVWKDPEYKIAKKNRDPTPLMSWTLAIRQSYGKRNDTHRLRCATFGLQAEWLRDMFIEGKFVTGSYCFVRGRIWQRPRPGHPSDIFIRADDVGGVLLGRLPAEYVRTHTEATRDLEPADTTEMGF